MLFKSNLYLNNINEMQLDTEFQIMNNLCNKCLFEKIL